MLFLQMLRLDPTRIRLLCVVLLSVRVWLFRMLLKVEPVSVRLYFLLLQLLKMVQLLR